MYYNITSFLKCLELRQCCRRKFVTIYSIVHLVNTHLS